MLKNHGKIDNSEWVMHFDVTSDTFSNVYDWFDNSLVGEEWWGGWRTDRTSLTIFIKSETAYQFALLRWI